MIIKYKNATIKFISYISAIFLILFIIINIFGTGKTIKNNAVEKSIISDSNESYTIYVEYPRFQSDKINTIITNKIYTYIKDFKHIEQNNKVLDITYDLYYIEDYVNISFHIENTQNKIKYQNILINLKTEKLDYISNLYDSDYLTTTINDLAYYKYSNNIYEEIKSSTVNNFTYIISDEKIDVYFNNINFEKLDYIPYITIDIENTVSNDIDYDSDNKKYIAFTYDDGPSKYTQELIKTLELNNSSATFFMIGNRMKNYEELIKKIYSSNNEIASHSYSHKDLTSISKKELEEELNSTNIIYNAITGSNIKYLRPPYNYYNDNVINTHYEIISWNIDPKDWLLKDSNKIYNNVISRACDGCIVVMHDIYEETLEATKKLLPKLNEMGYEVVSISKLAEIKNYDFKKDEVTSMIKGDE